MSTNHYNRWLPCYICGTMVLTAAPRVRCEECRLEDERKRSRGRYQCTPDPDAYLVVNDPDEIGGFPRGAVINREQMEYMLLESIAAFTPGTTLKNKAGQLFRVVKVKRKFELRAV